MLTKSRETFFEEAEAIKSPRNSSRKVLTGYLLEDVCLWAGFPIVPPEAKAYMGLDGLQKRQVPVLSYAEAERALAFCLALHGRAALKRLERAMKGKEPRKHTKKTDEEKAAARADALTQLLAMKKAARAQRKRENRPDPGKSAK